MLSLRPSEINWSLGHSPNWEVPDDQDRISESSDGECKLKSTSESLVILQSLRQSRKKWLTATFPKFSSRSRGGLVPPPHTIINRGRCDIEIGPHIFPSTIIFEVHYPHPSQPLAKPTFEYQSPMPGGHTNSWQTTTQYGNQSFIPYGHRPLEPIIVTSTHTPTTTTEATKTSGPFLSSLGSSVAITQTLISDVNKAAASNPILANLLQLAASGGATPDQLKTLGLLIQSLAATGWTDGAAEASAASAKVTASQGKPSTEKGGVLRLTPIGITSKAPSAATLKPAFIPSKDLDIVLEFFENPSERWVLPRAPMVVERIADSGASHDDIILTAGVPFVDSLYTTADIEKGDPSIGSSSQRPVTFRLLNATSDIWECVSRWAGDQEMMETTRKAFERLLGKEPQRMFLAHRLLEGPLLTQIQAASVPPYTMKSIRPVQSDPTKPKRVRKPAVRKPAARKPEESAEAPARKKKKGDIPSSSKAIQATSYPKSNQIPGTMTQYWGIPLMSNQTLPLHPSSFTPSLPSETQQKSTASSNESQKSTTPAASEKS